MAKAKREPFIRIDRKVFMPAWQKILFKVGAIILALLICAIISATVATKQGSFFREIFVSTFASTRRGVTTFNLSKTTTLFWNTAILFLIALAVTPAFKMKFWNLGGEGQVLMGAFGSLIMMKFVAPSVGNNFASLLLMAALGVVFGVVWALIPAIFKCLFNTNETLFTLMMNYIATAVVGFFCYKWREPNNTVIGIVNKDTHLGWFPTVNLWDGKAYNYIIAIGLIIVVGVLIWAYLRFTKHGYELSVVGGSRNTAKYIGININMVVIRTTILSGALAGICGWLLVAAGSHSVTENLVNGRGFTGVLIAWLGHFNPLEMAGYSFLVAFVQEGGGYASGNLGYAESVVSVFVGIFFFLVIASEFFTNFSVHFNFKKKKEVDESPDVKEAK